VYTGSDPRAGSRREHAYTALKGALLKGDFPVGERLGEERIAAELGISRTPVREALSRIHSDGLVERHPDGGYAPVLHDLHRIAELYDVRFGLERWALSKPLAGGPPHDRDRLAGLRAEWRTYEPPRRGDADADFVLVDEDFHIRLAAASGNRALVEHLQAVNEQIRVVRIHDFLSDERVATTIEQHVGVLDAVLDGDLAEADRRLVDHFSESLAFVEQRAAMAIARMVERWRR
jgi:DNA-binding GntR family transcriptional regulator